MEGVRMDKSKLNQDLPLNRKIMTISIVSVFIAFIFGWVIGNYLGDTKATGAVVYTSDTLSKTVEQKTTEIQTLLDKKTSQVKGLEDLNTQLKQKLDELRKEVSNKDALLASYRMSSYGGGGGGSSVPSPPTEIS